MKSHFKYPSYVLRHKWFVLRAGILIGAPLWRLIIHDLSKFSPKEWTEYVHYFYDGGENENGFDEAWLKHQHRNPHHWQHWVLREDDGGTKLMEMPWPFVYEMVADWAGAGKAITGKWCVCSWYHENHHKILLHPATKELVRRLLKHFDIFEKEF